MVDRFCYNSKPRFYIGKLKISARKRVCVERETRKRREKKTKDGHDRSGNVIRECIK